MKKLVALLVVLSSLFCFASCGISNDPSDVKDALEEEGYDVLTLDSKAEFEEWEVDEYFDFLGLSMSGVDAIVVAAEDWEKPVVVIYFEKSKQAKEIEKDLEELLDDEDSKTGKTALEMLEGFGIKSFDKLKLKRSGKVVAFGHEDTIKIIK